MNKYRFYYRPCHRNADWALWIEWTFTPERADSRLLELRDSNSSFEWKMEIVEPTYRYRIMAQPVYNNVVDWFPIWKHKTFMDRKQAAQSTEQLRAVNTTLRFKVQEEEVVD